MREKLTKLWNSSSIITAIGSLLLLAITIIPMIYIAQYVWPCADDFEMGLGTKAAFLETGSLWEVLKEAAQFAKYKYGNWQGTFSAIFLMALQPGIWGDEYYGIGAVIVIAGLLVSIFVLTYVLMVRLAKAPKSVWLILCILPLWAWVMRVMYTEEAFYWWNGAFYYIGFHACAMLITAAALCLWDGWEKYGKAKKAVCLVLGGSFCFFLGGGNYVTALMLVLVLGGMTVGALIGRKKSKIVLGVYFLSTLAALVISVAAPGNVAHMNTNFQNDISVVEAICIAIKDGLLNIRDWTNVFVAALYVFLLPFIWELTRKCPLTFRFPVLATILSGGLYLAGYAPISYTFGGYAPGRIVNLYYWNYYWLLLFNIFYWVGWIDRKVRRRCADGEENKKENVDGKPSVSAVVRIAGKQNKWQPVYICMAGVLFLLAIKQTGIEDTNLYMLLKDLKAGVFQKADSFQQERKEYYEAHQGEDVVVERLPYRSEITFFVDLVYKDHVFNTTMAEYYGVKSISVAGE